MRFVKIKVVVAYLEGKICPILNLQGCKVVLKAFAEGTNEEMKKGVKKLLQRCLLY
jgi:hypothetical protein